MRNTCAKKRAMIPLKTIPWQSDAWTRALAKRSPIHACCSSAWNSTHIAVDPAADFPLRVPNSFVERMRVGDPNDPLLRQVLPLIAERERAPVTPTDPLGEATRRSHPA